MFDLKASYVKFNDFHRIWMNKVAATDVEKAAALKQLRLATKQEAKFWQEVFHLTDDLKSSGAELESAHQNISSLELWVKSKKHSIHWL